MQAIKQFLKFGIVGLSNTLISQIIYMIAVSLGAHYLVASVIAFIISVLNAFFWQNKFVFKEEEGKEQRVWWQVLLKTYAAYAFTGLLLNNLLLIMWIDLIMIEQFTIPITELINGLGIDINNHDLAVDLAPILNIIVNVPINFVINKFWAYRQKNTSNQMENILK